MTDIASFANAVLADLSAAGAFADWLQERDDPRARLLRIRWRRWQTERAVEEAAARRRARKMEKPFNELLDRFRMTPGVTVSVGHVKAVVPISGRADATFRLYVERRFAEEVCS